VDGALVVRITTIRDDSMSTKSVEFFFDFGSPASYLAWTQLPALCAASGATLIYRPMLLGGVFQATGNASPAAVPAKGRYMLTDLRDSPLATACRCASTRISRSIRSP
jgi:2-hydroxychromene-2-carboxylate isomerase